MENPKEVEKKVSNKRDSESVDNFAKSPPVPNIKPKAEQKEEILKNEEEVKSSKLDKERTKRQPTAETLNSISESLYLIQDIAKFIGMPEILNDKKGQYCVLLNAAIMGETARKVLDLLKINDEHMPRICKELPWQTLINLRTLCTHKSHLQELGELFKAIKSDVPPLEQIAINMKSLIDKRQHKRKEYESAPQKLAAIEAYLHNRKEIEKNKNIVKSKDELRKNNNINSLSKQVKGLKIIIDELDNIKAFLRPGNDLITLYAVQMAMVNIGLAVSDRLDEKFQEKHYLKINVPESNPYTWKNLVSIRETIIHENYRMTAERSLKEATLLQGSFHFFQGLYEQQNANLINLRLEFQQKLQADMNSKTRETEKQQNLALSETRAPITFNMPKAVPKIKAAAPPSVPNSGIIPPNQSAPSVKEEEKSSTPTKKM